MLDLSYNYGLGTNDNGNVLGITNNKNTARSQSFTYDGLNRLLTAQTASSWGVNFTGGIDAWGNLYHTSTIAGTATNPMSVNQAVNGNNQLTLLGYTYDAAGNVLADGINSGCGSYAYTWDAEERMTCGAGATYSYSGDNARVEKTGGSSTPTLYWGSLAESNTSGTLTSEYIFLNGRRIARRDVATGNVYYYFEDMLGSSNTVATATGALENESDFYPFGGELPVTQNLANQKYKFEGKERDPESASVAQPQGLDDFGARFVSSAMGRFMSPDWANSPEPVPYAKLSNPQSLNLYAFAQNNPESAPDLDGHLVSISSMFTWSSGAQQLEQELSSNANEMMNTDLDNTQAKAAAAQSAAPDPTSAPQTQPAPAPTAQQNVSVHQNYFTADSTNDGAQIFLTATVSGSQFTSFNWDQTVTTSDPTNGTAPNVPYKDNIEPETGKKTDTGYYQNSKQQAEAKQYGAKHGVSTAFYDDPHRRGNQNFTWSAKLSLVGFDKSGKATTLWTGTYGLSVSHGNITLSPLKEIH